MKKDTQFPCVIFSIGKPYCVINEK